MMLDGMTRDLKSEKNAPYVATLGLTTFVDELEALNDRYEQLTTQRTSQRNAEKMPDGDTVRKEMDQLYDYITTVAFCESVAKPTDATARFISELNAVIDEINALYNQRMGLTKKTDEETPLPPATDSGTTTPAQAVTTMTTKADWPDKHPSPRPLIQRASPQPNGEALFSPPPSSRLGEDSPAAYPGGWNAVRCGPDNKF